MRLNKMTRRDTRCGVNSIRKNNWLNTVSFKESAAMFVGMGRLVFWQRYIYRFKNNQWLKHPTDSRICGMGGPGAPRRTAKYRGINFLVGYRAGNI
jgi:hypothetical protein